MRSILIAEDDAIVRSGIVNSIDWEMEGFAQPRVASNGEEALRLFDGIDILLTDIKMPRMDGLELTARVRRLKPLVPIIILSCHNDFPYVRKALQLGAFDFLIKQDVSPQDILEALRRADKHCVEDRDKPRNADGATFFGDMAAAKHGWINSLLEGSEHCAETEHLGLDFPLNLDLDRVTVANLRIDYDSSTIADGYFEETAMPMAVIEAARKAFSPIVRKEIVYRSHAEYIILFSPVVGDDSAQAMLDAGDSALVLVSKVINAQALLAFSNPTPIWEVSKAYRETVDYLDRNRGTAAPHPLFCSDLLTEKALAHHKGDIMKTLHAALCSPEGFDPTILFARLSKQNSMGRDDIIEAGAACLAELMRKAEDRGMPQSELYRERSDFYARLYKVKSMGEMGEYLMQAASIIDEAIYHRLPAPIYEAMAFIKDNLGNPDLSLELVANHMRFSRSYFSQFFSTRTGISYVDFVTRERIKLAKEYFATGKHKVYEVASMVGYRNWRYFCQVYKQHTGKTISALRK